MALPLGQLVFSGIAVDAQAIATALQSFVQHGSRRFNVTAGDLTIISRAQNQTNPPADIAGALAMGIRLFDAIYYFSLPPGSRPAVAFVALDDQERDPTLDEIAKAVLYCYVYLLVRGRTPVDTDDEPNAQVPAFLRGVMALTDNPTDYAARICSFELNHVAPSWVKHINLGQLGAEVQNRIALGMVGYRIPGALTYHAIKPNADAEVINAVTVVRNFLQRGPVWDCVAITRTPAFQNATTNMNKNCMNLILRAFTQDAIDNLRATRVLPIDPVEDPKFNQWRTWNDQTFVNFTDLVFH
jgi:hypothetical protein